MIKAVLDVGSNSVLLTVAERTDSGWHPLFESTAVTSLGEGTKTTGLLSEAAMGRTLEAIRIGFEKAREMGASEVIAAATMAARIAKNTPEFLERARAQTTPVFVLSGEEEAQLGFESVANDPAFQDENRLTIIDVGGQSTEICTAQRERDQWKVLLRKSYPIGTLALRGSLENSESPGPRELLNACSQIDDLIGMVYMPGKAGKAVALGATGTNLVTIRDQIAEWDPQKVHGQILDYEEVSKICGRLCELTDEQRAEVVGMEKGREKTIHLGSLILERFMHASKVLECAVSVRGWRHALLEAR